MKFIQIKEDILKGYNDLEYEFWWYKYKVNIDLLRFVLIYTLTDEDGMSIHFTVNKEEYLKMKYKDLLRIVNQNIYYREWCK